MEVDYRKFPVLVVDDEPDILRAFSFNYGDEFDVVTAPNGAQGLEVLASRDPAVIVADQRMPAMSGTEFLERSMSLRPDAMRIETPTSIIGVRGTHIAVRTEGP